MYYVGGKTECDACGRKFVDRKSVWVSDEGDVFCNVRTCAVSFHTRVGRTIRSQPQTYTSETSCIGIVLRFLFPV